ncbi:MULTISPECIES: hypothetical protein [unclassified Streptomyces]|uniref:hypothetical protein n=1 Tax=unclassified Streptomyces TaxID=2593676 RepID=UPI0033312A13
MDVYEDPSAWTAEPVRPRWRLALRFAGSVVWFPVVCVLWAAVAVAGFVVGLFADALVSSRLERAYVDFVAGALKRVKGLASWCVTWPELLHEGDADYYRARVDRVVRDCTARATWPHRPAKSRPFVECAIPLRDYRGVGGWYVAEVALAQGWELRPTDAHREVRLWWSAASRAD